MSLLNRELFESAVAELARKHNVAVENLTEKQLADALKQAIECGDFQRYICEGSHRQAVVYIPFAREQELLGKIKELEEKYHELLFAVAKKYEGEDRHETALRYIREREEESSTSERETTREG